MNSKNNSDPQSNPLRVLILEDVPADAELMKVELSKTEIEFVSKWVAKKEDFERELEDFSPDIVLSDYTMPQFNGMEALEFVKSRYSTIPLIIVTGSLNEETAVECMRAGAADYVLKESLKRLAPAVEGALEKRQMKEEKERAEQAMKNSATEWRTTFDALKDAICLLDLEGKILRSNKAMADLLGKPINDIIDSTCWELVHGAVGPIEGCPVAQMKQTLQRETLVLPLGDSVLQVVTDPVLDDKGDLASAVHIISDITEKVRAEEKLKEYSEKLENMVEKRTKKLKKAQKELIRKEKLAVLGQLAGGVGHELRNPLGAIKNAAYFLNMALEDPDPEVKETVEILEREVGTSEKIIESLIGFARPEPTALRKADLNEIAREAVSRAAIPDNVEVWDRLDENLADILADPDQLARVFENIIKNAIQAMPEGGKLVIKSQKPGVDRVAVSFTDTGKGIAGEELKKVFEPLFTTRAKGIGMGLALCKTLVEGHGGTIEVESEVGKGSTFTVWLPTKN